MLGDAIAAVQAQGVRTIELEVSQRNTAPIALCKSFGFEAARRAARLGARDAARRRYVAGATPLHRARRPRDRALAGRLLAARIAQHRPRRGASRCSRSRAPTRSCRTEGEFAHVLDAGALDAVARRELVRRARRARSARSHAQQRTRRTPPLSACVAGCRVARCRTPVPHGALIMRKPAVYIGNDRVLLWTKSGFKMFVDSRDVSIAPHLILEGVYEEHTDAVLRRIVKPGMHVVEIGANVGLFTLLMCAARRRSGSVYAFECDPMLARIARDNLEVNGLGTIGTIDERAVSKAGSAHSNFAPRLRHRGGGTLVAGLQQIPELTESERETIAVQAVTLDRISRRDTIARSTFSRSMPKARKPTSSPAVRRIFG